MCEHAEAQAPTMSKPKAVLLKPNGRALIYGQYQQITPIQFIECRQPYDSLTTKVAISLGIARGALQVFSDIAKNKIPMLSSASLAKRSITQYRMGVAEAKYRAARAFVMETLNAVEEN